MNKKDLKEILLYFLSWRILLFIFLFIGVYLLPLQKNYLGGGLQNYLTHPAFWAWSNFDGEHYLSIAQNGYKPLSYFFFPLYPLLIKFLAIFSAKAAISYSMSGLIVSLLSFFVALVGIWKLVLLDYKKEVARIVLMLILLFPTSFFFGSVYTESLFLALAVWSFYYARKGNFVLAGILGTLSSLTRITGVALAPAILVEGFLQNKRKLNKALVKPLIASFVTILGVFAYMIFLKQQTGDYLAFFHNLNSVFGEQRSASLVLLPQVFYRYIFKILPSVSTAYWPAIFTSWLEFVTGSVFFVLVLISLFKQRLSYALYALIVYLIPTFSGSFSSFPRYSLIIFPVFILAAKFMVNKRKTKRVILLSLFLLLIIATSLFVRGYWVS